MKCHRKCVGPVCQTKQGGISLLEDGCPCVEMGLDSKSLIMTRIIISSLFTFHLKFSNNASKS